MEPAGDLNKNKTDVVLIDRKQRQMGGIFMKGVCRVQLENLTWSYRMLMGLKARERYIYYITTEPIDIKRIKSR